MLGIRHYHGVAIDLWLGETSDFSCDKNIKEVSQLYDFDNIHSIHVSIDLNLYEVEDGVLVQKMKDAIDHLKKYIAKNSKNLRRVSFIFHSRDFYQMFQRLLFASIDSFQSL